MQELAAASGVDVIPNRSSRPAILLREAWREGTRIRRRTVANLSRMPPELVDAVRAALTGGIVLPSLDDAAAIRRSLPHGHVAAVLGTPGSLGMVRILGREPSRMRSLAAAAIAARLIDPGSKLACARSLSPETASSSLGPVSGNEMLEMLDWLRQRQPWIERSLAGRHLKGESALILYDVSSSYLEGRRCPLAAFGHNRDGKKGKKQITYGLLCAANGCPVAVEACKALSRVERAFRTMRTSLEYYFALIRNRPLNAGIPVGLSVPLCRQTQVHEPRHQRDHASQRDR
ncbi:MAG: hypothetical protein OXI87_04970 [Albidovulum sp.]|nr:hypothetical protein [Albidovulum sp.]